MLFNRRHWLCSASALLLASKSAQAERASAKVLSRPLVFPADHGAHNEFRTEWWYLTGWLQAANPQANPAAPAQPLGFQVTFFRSRVDANENPNPSAFTPRQLLFAHAALSDPAQAAILHDQRIARAGLGLAEASTANTAVHIRDWRLAAQPSGYVTRIKSAEFALELTFVATQPVLLQGQAGVSRKGPRPQQSSYYYSRPQLKASGTVTLKSKAQAVQGVAWLDHEWSETLLDPEAVGWDWIGMNLFDGAALTAFQLRRADGSALWAGGSHRSAAGVLTVFGAADVSFATQRVWTSPATLGKYPVEVKVRTPQGSFSTRPALDNQELDSRSSTGTVYWEGLSELLDAEGRAVGRGYLELTGYVGRLVL
jgi:predicted secreted hydrolase